MNVEGDRRLLDMCLLARRLPPLLLKPHIQTPSTAKDVCVVHSVSKTMTGTKADT